MADGGELADAIAAEAERADEDALALAACEALGLMDRVRAELTSGDDARIRRALAGALLPVLRSTADRCGE